MHYININLQNLLAIFFLGSAVARTETEAVFCFCFLRNNDINSQTYRITQKKERKKKKNNTRD